MIVIVDGYNLLAFLHGTGKTGFQEREKLVQALVNYFSTLQRGKAIIAFDGGIWSHAQREHKNGIDIVYVGNGVSADDWICSYISCNKEYLMTLVTNDKELKKRAKARSRTTHFLSCKEFSSLLYLPFRREEDPLQEFLIEKWELESSLYETEEDIDFLIMLSQPEKKIDEEKKEKRKASPSSSKKEKIHLSIIEKLKPK